MVVLRLSEHTDHVNIRSNYLKAVTFLPRFASVLEQTKNLYICQDMQRGTICGHNKVNKEENETTFRI